MNNSKSKFYSETAQLLPTGSISSASIFECAPEHVKQNSVVTIFVIWNTMIGSSLLAMPWGIEKAGLFGGALLIILIGGLCLYTSHCVMKTQEIYGHIDHEISDLAGVILGNVAQFLAKVFSWIVLLGSNIVYWILMSNFLFYSVDFIHSKMLNTTNIWLINSTIPVLCHGSDQLFDHNTGMGISFYRTIWNLNSTVPIFLAILILPLLNFKSPTFFTKFNSFGTISVLYIIVFVFIKGISWGININMTNTNYPTYSFSLSTTFPATTGLLALSYFIQNIIITVMRSNRHQHNNGRDLSIAYILVTTTYVTIGTVFYITFPLPKKCIEDNMLNNFPSWDILTVLARMFLFFQLLTVFPLMSFMLRVQVMMAFFSNGYPNRTYVVLFNVILVTICILFAIFLPRIGTIIRFTGALSGFYHVFTLPCLLRIAVAKKTRQITTTFTVLHLVIPFIGALNLVAQFFVSDV